jgi:hypothetical protein
LKRLTIAAACAALATLSVSTAAFAADPVTVKLSQPIAQPVKFIAGGAIFDCADDACVAKAATSETFSTATCKQIAAKMGPVTSFTSFRTMDDQRLTACNTSAKGAQVAKQ